MSTLSSDRSERWVIELVAQHEGLSAPTTWRETFMFKQEMEAYLIGLQTGLNNSRDLREIRMYEPPKPALVYEVKDDSMNLITPGLGQGVI